ncbi:hypothetical protein AB0H36_32290 [Kribbella sp. NPDC050820]|uniref:TY-Chap2 family putative peptide chaperone n=1 Tax=Kribbella sp. NPDC050820 TaxID=3155408 RepID=UPI0033FF3DD7
MQDRADEERVRQLLFDITNCADVPAASFDSTHPCHKIVGTQRGLSDGFQVPEPWAGHIGLAPLLFVSSNPSISEAEPYPTWADDRERRITFFEERFGDGPGQVKDGVYFPLATQYKGSWHSPRAVQFWNACKRNAELLFQRAVRPGVDYAMTEVVHCKSHSEKGVQHARQRCSNRWLRAILEVSPATVVVVLGEHARVAICEHTSGDLAYWTATRVAVAGRDRVVAVARHPNFHGPRKWTDHFAESALAELSNALRSESNSQESSAETARFESSTEPATAVALTDLPRSGAHAVAAVRLHETSDAIGSSARRSRAEPAALNSTVVEAASWRLASELARRHPGVVRVTREHPGGGLYDVLALRSDAGLELMLNRQGTIQIHGRHDQSDVDWAPTPWVDYLAHDPRAFLEWLESAAGLPLVQRVPASTPTTLVYRTLAGIAATSFMTLHSPEIEMGYIDTAGYGGGPASWLDMFPIGAEVRRPQPADLFGQPGYRFWMCRRPGLMLAFETSNGTAWATRGEPVELMQRYQAVGRDIDALTRDLMLLGSLPARK